MTTAPPPDTPGTTPARTRRPLRLAVIGGVAIAALALAACGSSSSKSSSAKTTADTKAAAATTKAQLKLASADVGGLGKILVNDKGMTLYILETADGKPVPCTGDCEKVWPPAKLPDGTTAVTAGTGLDQSLLGTVKATDDADLYATYNSWPVYTFVKDTAPGQAFGQGLQSFGGTWHVLDAKGHVVTAAASTAGATTTTKAASSSGY